MEKCRFILSIAIIMLISSVVLTQREPNESHIPEKRSFERSVFIDFCIGLRFPGVDPNLSSVLTELNKSSISEEALFATYSFSDADTTYNVELYYRELYHRLRARVLVGDRELRGLFNRFYDIDSRESMIFVLRSKDGSLALSFNFGGFSLKESSLNTDAIYDALEDFIAKSSPQTRNPGIRVYGPTGMLKKTCEARALRDCYLINEEGQVEPFTLENLLIAYCREGIKVGKPDDFERIGRSIVKPYSEVLGVTMNIILDVNEIRKYSSNLLISENEHKVRPPWSYRDSQSQTDYWICYAFERYKMGPGMLVCYKLGFQNGLLRSGERIILGEDKTGAYTGYPRLRSLRDHKKVVIGKNNVDLISFFSTTMLMIIFVGAGVFLLVLAYVVHRYFRPSSGASTHIVSREPPVSGSSEE